MNDKRETKVGSRRVHVRIIGLLRIAMSAASLIVCSLLITYWVRSIYTVDCLYWLSDSRAVQVWSSQSKVLVNMNTIPTNSASVDPVLREKWRRLNRLIMEVELHDYREMGYEPMEANSLGFKWQNWRTFVMPYWFLVVLTALFAAAPWFPRSTQFSLRALLIAITFVAVVLGLVVAFRQP
jgi:hypothetical protein